MRCLLHKCEGLSLNRNVKLSAGCIRGILALLRGCGTREQKSPWELGLFIRSTTNTKETLP